ncbi:hypothetical protein HYH02_011352 [Chlamydomonas schloesseri]|uniref:C-type lectin domain-containing protein n=1 Tax=Chlamydomonas schloesseri TaxID=2026947 RepID=A0A835T1G1_9CHLO|nr:hypothetical protein HYH02_011352 [Chlamydomonas schloesseri]|eukprot:KAG2437094.1 hypothetical protein HYH02_011352 [Chlamydomonas schloesseri]
MRRHRRSGGSLKGAASSSLLAAVLLAALAMTAHGPAAEKSKGGFKPYAFRKKFLYLQSDDPDYTYDEAQEFCREKGLFVVGYDDKLKQVPMRDLCYKSGKDCWVNGRVGNQCALIGPEGNGEPYPDDCDRKHHAVCWGDLDKQMKNPLIWKKRSPPPSPAPPSPPPPSPPASLPRPSPPPPAARQQGEGPGQG